MPIRKRCPNGTRKNKKTGNCEKKSSIKKRCPNGSRRNNKTGNCEKLNYKNKSLSNKKKSSKMSERKYLSKEDQEYIREFIKEDYGNDRRVQKALNSVSHIYFDPEYRSQFDNQLFTGKYKERYQAMDRIQGFFKFSGDDGSVMD